MDPTPDEVHPRKKSGWFQSAAWPQRNETSVRLVWGWRPPRADAPDEIEIADTLVDAVERTYRHGGANPPGSIQRKRPPQCGGFFFEWSRGLSERRLLRQPPLVLERVS